MLKTFQVACYAGLLSLLMMMSSNSSAAAETEVRQIWQILDYLAVDYAGAVEDGKIIHQFEFDEMREFAHTARTKISSLEPHPQRAALLASADQLSAAIDAHQSPVHVAQLARALGSRLLVAYPIPTAPATTPDLSLAAALYQTNCAACHGTTGDADGPLAAQMTPPPVAFSDDSRARERSPFALYQVITQGLTGTQMVGFNDKLSEADRWALAFYVGQFAYNDQMRSQGEQLWQQDPKLHEQVPNLGALTNLTEAALAQHLGDASKAQATMAYLRATPTAVSEVQPKQLQLARLRLTQSLHAYQEGNLQQARDLALSAYLDGVEPIEPALATRNSDLLRQIEKTMGSYRALVARQAPIAELRAQVDIIEDVFDAADTALLPTKSNATTAFFGSFMILLREGLEALLVVIAMIAFLKKAERQDVLPYVHAGWLGALGAGVLTWAIATYVVGISGANRELTEGFSALFAAIVLLSVGIWMHQKSVAGRWQQYVKDKLSAALNKRSVFLLFSLSFVAVYREVFETILFYAAMWDQGSNTAVLAGLGTGIIVLMVVAVLLLRYSQRLPIAKFFSFSSIMVAILAVVLTGKGIAALQEAGWIHVYPVPIPRLELLGLYPSAQSALAQLVVLVIVIIAFMYNSRPNNRPSGTAPVQD